MNPNDGSPAPDEGGNNTMAAVLIGVAVLIGIVLLAKGLSQEGGVVETAAPKTETTTTTAAASQPPADNGGQANQDGQADATTTTTGEVRNPSEVSVMVANGSGAVGVAGNAADELKAAGYKTVDTTNASVVTTSSVYFDTGYEAEAKAVADVLGISASAVAELPASPPAQPKGASVLVVIGPEWASSGGSGGASGGAGASGGGSTGGTTATSTLSPVTR